MNETKLLVPAILLIAVILMSACAKSEDTTGPGFLGGAEGLAISFQSTPAEAMEGAQLPITLILENKGEANVAASELTGGTLCISGPVLVDNSKLQKVEYITDLGGARKIAGNQIPGGNKVVNIIAKVPPVEGDVPITISATARYTYRTTALASVCISPNALAQTLGQQVCQPNEIKPVSSSGAPIKVTEVREIASASGDETHLLFLIKVRNVGRGIVYDAGTGFRDCVLADDMAPLEHVNRVSIESAKIGVSSPIVLACQSPITLVDGEGSTTCEGTATTQSAYEEPLYLTLKYAYSQLTTQKLIIRNIN